jgi:hypothetical protein
MTWDLVGELRQLSHDIVNTTPQSEAIKGKHPAILDAAAKRIVDLEEETRSSIPEAPILTSFVGERRKAIIWKHEGNYWWCKVGWDHPPDGPFATKNEALELATLWIS